MTTFTLRANAAGHWDVFANIKPPVATFLTLDEAIDYVTDLAKIRTMGVRMVVEFEEPKFVNIGNGFFHVPKAPS